MHTLRTRVMPAVALACTLAGAPAAAQPVKTANGTVEGTKSENGILVYRGIPFAAPPTGDRRWKPPQPVANWTGVKKAENFSASCMQRKVFGDMSFRASGMSEDCLYLNVWTPKVGAAAALPVLVYFYGGGYIAGDGSEPRYDGEAMARKGIVALTVNYRLNVFGFLAHPELTCGVAETRLRQLRAARSGRGAGVGAEEHCRLRRRSRRVTIAGESAGSISVSALMVSPLSKGLIAGAIGESGG